MAWVWGMGMNEKWLGGHARPEPANDKNCPQHCFPSTISGNTPEPGLGSAERHRVWTLLHKRGRVGNFRASLPGSLLQSSNLNLS